MKKKIISLVALALSFTCFAACGGTVIDKEDKTKSHHLYVGVFNGGFGIEWLKQAIDEFVKIYPDTEIKIDDKKDEFQTAGLESTIHERSNDLYIAPTNYLRMIANGDMAQDITSIVTSPISLAGGVTDTSIANRMDKSFKEFYNVGTEAAPKYYAVPVGGSVWGINYDYDLFEEEKLFISYNGDGEIVWTSGINGDPEKSVGRDGVKGTYDDGTPVTFAEFRTLLNKMVAKGITPFIWADDMASYRFYWMMSMWADYEGKDRMEHALRMDGTTLDIYDTEKAGFSEAMTSEDRQVAITDKTGYYLPQMKGKAAALELSKLIMSDKEYYDARSMQSTTSFTQAQSFYVQSKAYASTGKGNRVAFLVDGGHWYNEIKLYSDTYTKESYPEYAEKGRRFSVMPFPVVEGSKNEKTSYLRSSANFAAFIRQNAKEKETAEKFLQFLFTTERIKNTALTSGMLMYYDYEVTQAEIETLPYYYQIVQQINHSDKADLVNENCNSAFYKANPNYQVKQNILWLSQYQVGGQTVSINNSFYPFKDYGKLTVHTYMLGSKDYYTESFWTNSFAFLNNN